MLSKFFIISSISIGGGPGPPGLPPWLRQCPHPCSNPASSEATDTPFTKLCANAFGAPGYLNLFAPSRPNLNLFPKGKNDRSFCPEWFRTHARTHQ